MPNFLNEEGSWDLGTQVGQGVMFLIQLLPYKGKEDSSLLSFLCSSLLGFFLSVVTMHPWTCSSLFFPSAFLPFPLFPAPLSPLKLPEDQLNTTPPSNSPG